MVEHICEKCNKVFHQKSKYVLHINRKNPCDQTGTKCNICEKEFCRKDYFKKHVEKCKLKNPEKYNKIINNENNIANVNGPVVNGDNNNVTSTNNIINITINPFLQDDMSKLSDKQKINILKKCYMVIPEIIKQVNFNPNIPENHNMYISNITSKFGKINNGNKWIIEKVDKLIDDVISKKKDDIEELLEQFEEEIPEKVIDKIRDVMETLDYDPLSDEIKDKQKIKFRKKIIDEVKMLLYNNKDIPIKTSKKIENKAK
jgi:hypothetical protein